MARADPQPKVSVLLQTYNHERFIERAIESVLEQEVPFPLEVIVSDDCSSDRTRESVSRYANAHPELIRTLFPDRHLGMNPLFRQALDAARGDYLALLDGDDFWTGKDKLRRQVRLLDAEPELTGCFHDALVVSEDETQPPRRYIPEQRRKELFTIEDLLRLCYPPTLSVTFRRELLKEVPEWAFESAWADWVIWILATRRGPFAYIDEVLGVYRVHEGGYFSSQDRSTQLEEDLRVYQHLLDELPDHRELIERCIAERGCELAVEESAIPYDAPVVVVGEMGDMPLLFNGRTTRCVSPSEIHPAAGESEDHAASEQLERLCREGTAKVTPLWRARKAPRESGAGRCYVVVPSISDPWLATVPDLAARLEHDGFVLWRGAHCVIYELPKIGDTRDLKRARMAPTEPPRVEVVEVARANPTKERARGKIDAPPAGSLVDPLEAPLGGLGSGPR